MSKEADKIIEAYRKGEEDKRARRTYSNPYGKNTKERDKRRAYQSGWNNCP